MVALARTVTILMITSTGLMAMAESLSLNAEDPFKKSQVAELNRCREAVEKLKTDKASRKDIEDKRYECNEIVSQINGDCKDTEKLAQDAVKSLNDVCSSYGSVEQCLKKAEASQRACLKGDSKNSRNEIADRKTYNFQYLTEDKKDTVIAGQCVRYGLTEYQKQKAEFKKDIDNLQKEITSSESTLARAKKDAQEQSNRATQRRVEAERQYNKLKDSQVSEQQKAAASLAQQVAQLESNKADLVVKAYEPRMKETQSRADEKVALKKFADIRGMCTQERDAHAKAKKESGSFSNQADQFSSGTLTVRALEEIYYTCVETYQEQVRSIKRSHAQARAGYREQGRNYQQQMANLDGQRQLAQQQQAQAMQQISASNAEASRLMQDQMAQFKKEIESAQTAEKQAERDNAKRVAALDDRLKEVYQDIDNMGGMPAGGKLLNEAIGAKSNLLYARSNLQKKSCSVALASVDDILRDDLKLDMAKVDPKLYGNTSSSKRVGEASEQVGRGRSESGDLE